MLTAVPGEQIVRIRIQSSTLRVAVSLREPCRRRAEEGRETQGLVVLEAMASGTPVAGMNCRAIPEFVRDDFNGTLFGPGTCADGIRRCLDGREGFRMNALDTARRYSSTACAERLEAAYERAASMKKARIA